MADDAELARRAAGGDPAAFASLVRLHEAAVRRFLVRLVRGDGADDLAQEVFLKAWRMRAAARDEQRYGAWIMRIAWTSFLEERRATRRRHARDDRAYCTTEAVSNPSGETRIDVARALSQLNARERAVAQLCFGEGHSHAEAAFALDLPLGTVKSIAARAKAHLARALEPTS